jgi:Zn-dependent protease with chaperone function
MPYAVCCVPCAVAPQLVMPFWTVAMNAFVRRLEFSADAYSAQLGFDLSPPLIAICKKNLGERRAACLPACLPALLPACVCGLRSLALSLSRSLLCLCPVCSEQTTLPACLPACAGDLQPDWLVSMCHDNHPTLLERIRALKPLRGEGGGGAGQGKKQQ